MPDRSSSQGPPDDWSRGSHAARGPHPGPGGSDTYGSGTGGAHAAGAPDGYGAARAAGAQDGYGAAHAAGAQDGYGAAHAAGAQDGYGAAGTAAFRTGTAEGFRAGTADGFRAGAAEGFRAGTADPFGDADPFGEGGLFGPAPGRAFGAGTAEAATAYADAEPPGIPIADSAPGKSAGAKGFLGALFDFGFTSFVTPKVIKALYILIMIGTTVSALVFTIIAFRVSTAFGIVTLLFADPLFILIVMAISRMILEFFVVAFRMAEDIRALREGDDRG